MWWQSNFYLSFVKLSLRNNGVKIAGFFLEFIQLGFFLLFIVLKLCGTTFLNFRLKTVYFFVKYLNGREGVGVYIYWYT